MIGLVGINHKTAPVKIRETFAFVPDEIAYFVGNLIELSDITEVVLLSTCNRTELYYFAAKDCGAKYHTEIIRSLAECKGIREDITGYFYSLKGEEAARHLMRVASGLNSMVLGENQILGQLKEAYRISCEHNFTGTVLNRLFHKAFEAGKRVRSETAINKGAASVSFAAVELCEKIFENLSSHPLLLIGAGETGELVLKNLTERGVRDITIINRTYKRACEQAAKYGAKAVKFEELKQSLASKDIIITSTASTRPVILFSDVKGIMKKRKSKTIFFIDLAVPRNIDEKVKDIHNVLLYNIDDLEKVTAHNYEKRKAEIEKADTIIDKICRDFSSWFNTLKMTPTIESLNCKFDSMNEQELRRLKSKLSDNEYQKVQEYARFIKGKYLGLVIKNLKRLSDTGKKLEYIDLVNELFELKGRIFTHEN
ncbi:MAG: glutamyl-tRNA reductase [Spirochaetota bacterium]